MARGWSFVGGLMIVTTITYLNMTTITIIAKDIQTSLIRERKKLDDARNNSAQSSSSATTATSSTQDPPKLGDIITWPTTTRVADRMKKIWNEDIERSVRRMQNTDWERMGRAVEGHMKRARERMATSFERMGEDSKKNST
jgi:hypothetical protein